MTAEEFRAAVARYYVQLDRAAEDFAGAAQRRGVYSYMWGTFVGVGILGLILILLSGMFYFYGLNEPGNDLQFRVAAGCAMAGGLGACASVSWRVVSFARVRVDTGATVQTLRRVGSIRPLVGAIFGLAAYFALQSGFIDAGHQNFYFFAFFAFVAGFSERLLPDLVSRTEATVAGQSNGARP